MCFFINLKKMKKIILITGFLLFIGAHGFTQQKEDDGGKIREKMTEYLQKRLRLSKNEADKFSPVELLSVPSWTMLILVPPICRTPIRCDELPFGERLNETSPSPFPFAGDVRLIKSGF